MGFKPRPYDDLYAEKTDIEVRIVALMRGHCRDRGLKLIPEQTRAVLKREIHEFILTDEPEALPGGRVNRIAYLGFGEVRVGGVLAKGDKLHWDGREIGTLAGFDHTHMPNHMNIVFYSSDLRSGEEQGLKPEQVITVSRRGGGQRPGDE